MPTTTRRHGSAEPSAPQSSRPIPRSVPALSPGLVLQKARTTGGADLSAAEVRLLHRTVGNRAVQRLLTGPAAPDRTGLPDALKAGVERLSGVDLSAVQVHYNSTKPAGLQALACTQGADIHLAPGQERHLPHEAWHVVQQAQGRVRPTLQMKHGDPVNDDEGLEHEADVMGAKALQMRGSDGVAPGAGAVKAMPGHAGSTIQRFPAVMPDKKDKGTSEWAMKTLQVNSPSDFDKFVSQLVGVSKTTGVDDPYTQAIETMQAQIEKVTVGAPAWKDVVIRAVIAVRTAKASNAMVTVEGVKKAAKVPVKEAKPAEAEPSVNLADLLERCQFMYGKWTKYNERTGQMASCAVREFPKVAKRPDIHATFFLDKNKEDRVVKGVTSMRAHLQLLHLTVENGATPKENTRYWPLDKGQFTGKDITPVQQNAVKALWEQVRTDLEQQSAAQ